MCEIKGLLGELKDSLVLPDGIVKLADDGAEKNCHDGFLLTIDIVTCLGLVLSFVLTCSNDCDCLHIVMTAILLVAFVLVLMYHVVIHVEARTSQNTTTVKVVESYFRLVQWLYTEKKRYERNGGNGHAAATASATGNSCKTTITTECISK